MQRTREQNFYSHIRLRSVRRVAAVELAPPEVFSFDDFHALFGALWSYWKGRKRALSLRYAARFCKVKSPSVIAAVKAGELLPSLALGDRLVKLFALKGDEAAFMTLLLRLARAEHDADRQHIQEEIRRARGLRSFDVVVTSRESDGRPAVRRPWLLPVLIEMLGLHDFQGTEEWFVSKIGWLASREEIGEGLAFLMAEGSLVERGGRWEPTGKPPKFPGINHIVNDTVKSWPHVSANGAYFRYSVNAIALDGSRLLEVYERIRNFQKETSLWADEHERKDTLLQLCTVTYAVTEDAGESGATSTHTAP